MRVSTIRSQDGGVFRFAAEKEAPAEIQFLLYCVKRELGSEATRAARRIATGENFDWGRFTRLVVQHRVVPFVRTRFSENDGWGAPQEIMAEFDRRLQAAAFRNLQLVSELVRLDRILSRAGMRAIWFKGPILASQAYRSLIMRQFDDLDLLILRERAGDVFDILQREGYAPSYNVVSPEKLPLLLRVTNEHLFSDAERQIFLDVHWAVANSHYSFSSAPLQTNEIEIAGRRVSTFGAEATLCFLCFHGCKHNWTLFRCIVDIAEFIRNHPELAWETLISCAPPIGAPRMIRLGLALAHIAADAPLPQIVVEWIERDDRIAALAAKALERCLVSPAPFDARIFLSAMESRADRMRFMMEIILNPSVIEIERATIPEDLFFVYTWLRFYRLFRKHVVNRAIGVLYSAAGLFRIQTHNQ